MKKCFLKIMVLVMATCMLLTSCGTAVLNVESNIEENANTQNKVVENNSQISDSTNKSSGVQKPETLGNVQDATNTTSNHSDVLGENGELLLPFDQAYPEAFESGEIAYDTSSLLIKMNKDFDGELNDDLRSCGFSTIEELFAMSNTVWYKAFIAEGTDIHTAMSLARENEDILLADYDYIVETASVEESSTPIVAASTETQWWSGSVAGNSRISEQWYLNSCNIQQAWAALEADGINAGGSSSVIVAVIDTGVDYTHPDLASSMWVNKGEIAGNGIDDDGNGYVDDIHGCSTIGSSYDHNGDPMDDHGHGTHVAGIIGAANNKEGIVGIAYNTKIMVIKAGQASGSFNQSDIAEAILYAYENGAEVINMSFGGSACSLAVQEALELAWTRAVLVASAGNDGTPNEDWGELGTNIVHYGLPNYPAALHYVMGVMSVGITNAESLFTNWDSFANTSIEYEVYAPGEQMLSTLPGGKYGYLSGTSMAAPVVSAIAALLRSKYTDRDMYPAKFIDGQICSTSETYSICWNPDHKSRHNEQMVVDAYTALTKMPKPDIYLYDTKIFDDVCLSDANNGDGYVNAGETLNIGAVLYNRWGMSKDTVIQIDSVGGIMDEENPYVEIITGTSNFEGVGTYSTKDQFIRDQNGLIIGVDEPLVVKIKDDCPNDYLIVLNVTLSYKNGLDEKDTNSYIRMTDDAGGPLRITFTVRNGAKFPNVIDKDMVITNDKYYILDDTCTILRDVTLTIEEGVQIQMSDSSHINCFGTLVTQGTELNPVKFITGKGNVLGCSISESGEGRIYFNYTTIDGRFNIECTELNHCNCLLEFRSPNLSSYNDHVYVRNKIACSYIEYGGIQTFSIEKSTIYMSEVTANTVKDSIILSCSFDGSIENGHRGTFSANRTERCIIYDSGYGGVSCIFLGYDNARDITAYKNNDDYGITRFVKNEETNTTYVCISNVDLNDLQFINKISTVLGGTISCIETPEEYEFLWANQIYGYYGLQYGEDCWVNGEPIGEWLYIANAKKRTWSSSAVWVSMYNVYNYGYMASPSLEDEVKDKFYLVQGFLTYDGGMACVPKGHTESIVFEISNTDLTEDQVQNIIDNCPNDRTHNMFGNVILNDFGSDVSNWVKIVGESHSDYEDCETINLPNIYWGTTDLELIEAQIVDFDDNIYRDQLDPTGFLVEAPSDTMPFVVDAYLLNQNGERVRTVNNETVTFVVEFNRDMDTSVPLKVTFGSSEEYFYEDYNISEYGNWVTPRRWEATYTLKTIIENGNHTIKIENGCAADDEWLKLYDVPGRFMFEIDTTAAQALIMQGHATETGIQLNWMQDDYDTLMGYNVYRSDREDGYYQRLNSSVIPFDQKEFFDDTVEPGKVYYYNFTVVKTDLSESEPSGKISLMSMDTMAPNIYHSPVYSGYLGSNLIVGATVTDNLGLQEVKLYYRAVGSSEWRSVTMSVLNNRYTGLIAADFLSADGIEYYIRAYDGINYTYKGSADMPFIVAIQAAVDASSLGDVDGDGMITNKDALMLLQAANDLLNLTEEQFLRADIDGNKELSASEALRILQYVSGKVTTIVG